MPAMAAFNTGYCRFRDFCKKRNNVMEEWNEFTDFFNGQCTARIEKTIMPYFHKPLGKNMLQEPPDELHCRKCHDFPLFLFTVFVPKFDDIIFNAFDTIVGDGNPEHISWKVTQRFLSLTHLMFGIIALTSDQLMRFVT